MFIESEIQKSLSYKRSIFKLHTFVKNMLKLLILSISPTELIIEELDFIRPKPGTKMSPIRATTFA